MRVDTVYTSLDGDLLAVCGGLDSAGRVDGTVSLVSLQSGLEIVRLDTPYQFGGKRLALNSDATALVAGGYNNRKGVAAYELPSGKLLWTRKDVKKIQRIKFTSDNLYVLICTGDGPVHIVGTYDGRTSARLRAVRKAWDSPYEDLRFLDKGDSDKETPFPELVTTGGQRVARIDRKRCTVRNAVFAPGMLLLEGFRRIPGTSLMDPRGSEALTWTVWTKSGDLIWETVPSDSDSFLPITFFESKNVFVAIERSDFGSHYGLVHISRETGEMHSIRKGVTGESFCKRGSLLVGRLGVVYDSSTGEIVKELPFASLGR